MTQKEFYFIRHGQTDANILEGIHKGNHPEDISLNATGIHQAKCIEPIISSLPIQTICSSPLKRAQETKEIISLKLQAQHINLYDLSECSLEIWKELIRIGMHNPIPKDSPIYPFIDRVQNGLNHILTLPGPSLIVAHGGIHWAICYLMNIENHTWAIDNCIPVHFAIEDQGKWTAKNLVHNPSLLLTTS